MSRSVLQPSQQKLAEKLTILNDRGVGMLTRLYNIKKVRTGRRGRGGGGGGRGRRRRGRPGLFAPAGRARVAGTRRGLMRRVAERSHFPAPEAGWARAGWA
jgi:hypothetical protein